MNFDTSLFLNFIPIISAIILTFSSSITIYYRLKNRSCIQVNCWFCNKNTKIEKQSLNWWSCFHCSQYNGFSKDGDYNYEIPEQHEKLNDSFFKYKSYCQRKSICTSQNTLCKQCNRKEEFKLLKLRELEHSFHAYNYKQIEQFEKSFEQKYPLCLKCQTIVKSVLHKQTLWLIQYKMLFFKQKPIRRLMKNHKKIERILHIVLLILALTSIYFVEALYLPPCGIFFQLAACVARPGNKWQSEILPIIGWSCLVLLRTFSSNTIMTLFKMYFNINSVITNDKIYHYFVIVLGTAIALVNLKFKPHSVISNEFVSFKKLESATRKIFTARSPSLESIKLHNKEQTLICNKKPIQNFYSTVNITDSLVIPSSVEIPVPLKPTNFSQWVSRKKLICSPSYMLSKRTTLQAQVENSFSKTFNNNSYTLNDSLSSLNALSLGTKQGMSTSHSPGIFETRVYGTNSPDLFNKLHQYNHKQSILAPAKLQSITQTSWVASGYWQSIIETPTLSHSLSQSSGFSSPGSNDGLSRESSVQEFDQYSIASEHCCFPQPESQLSAKISNVIKRQDNCLPKYFNINEILCNTDSLKYHLRNDSHYNKIITIIPVWLTVLLCGSLVFNIVVLCTILLHRGFV